MVNAGDKDRRFCVLDCYNPRIADKKYFKDYENNVNKNKEAIRCIYEYLKTFDIEEVVPDMIFADARPKTELYEELVESNKSNEWEFMNEYLFIQLKDKDKRRFEEDGIYHLTNEELWTSFKNFCQDNNIENKLVKRRFLYIFVRTIVSSLNNIFTKKTKDNKRGFNVNIAKLQEHYNNQD